MLKAAPYPIHFRQGEFRHSLAELKAFQPSKLFVLCDSNTAECCYPLVEEHLPSHQLIVIPPGEEAKSLESCQIVWQTLTEAKADRQALLLNLGGGMIGDLGGFAASSYKRGIRFAQMPSSLLAQVDASVGGKTGVNFLHYKNQIGAFSNPVAVWGHKDFHKTLPLEELRSGYAEMLKNALIADAAGWEQLSAQPGIPEDYFARLPRSVEIKLHIVQQDPFEKGPRKALNFGHTIGHALESYFLDAPQALKHGEAIAIGMLCEAWISTDKGLLSQTDCSQITNYIREVYPKREIDPDSYSELLALMGQDKKNHGGQISFTLLKGIGGYSIDESAHEEQIRAALDFYLEG